MESRQEEKAHMLQKQTVRKEVVLVCFGLPKTVLTGLLA